MNNPEEARNEKDKFDAPTERTISAFSGILNKIIGRHEEKMAQSTEITQPVEEADATFTAPVENIAPVASNIETTPISPDSQAQSSEDFAIQKTIEEPPAKMTATDQHDLNFLNSQEGTPEAVVEKFNESEPPQV